MYRGTNPKALQSQQLLAEALVRLLGEKDYYQISVFDICQSASLSRQTFYNFFNSKEEILHFFFKNQFDLEHKDNLTDIFKHYSAVLNNNKALLRKMLKFGLEGIATEEISKSFLSNADNLPISAPLPHLLWLKRSLASGAVAHLLIEWFRGNMAETINEISSMIYDMLELSPTLYNYSSKDSEENKHYGDTDDEKFIYKENEEEHREQQSIPLFLL